MDKKIYRIVLTGTFQSYQKANNKYVNFWETTLNLKNVYPELNVEKCLIQVENFSCKCDTRDDPIYRLDGNFFSNSSYDNINGNTKTLCIIPTTTVNSDGIIYRPYTQSEYTFEIFLPKNHNLRIEMLNYDGDGTTRDNSGKTFFLSFILRI
jgi:hypothetical protein